MAQWVKDPALPLLWLRLLLWCMFDPRPGSFCMLWVWPKKKKKKKIWDSKKKKKNYEVLLCDFSYHFDVCVVFIEYALFPK